MKTLILIAPTLALAACGVGASPTVTVTAEERVVTVTAPPPVAPEPQGEVTVRSLLESSGFYYPGPDSDLDSVAQSICDAIDQGVSPTTIGGLAMDAGFTPDEAASIVAAAIVVKCPWNQNAV